MDTVSCDFTASENLIDVFILHEYAIRFIHMYMQTKAQRTEKKVKKESKKELWIMVLSLKLEATHLHSTCFDTLIKNAAVFITFCLFSSHILLEGWFSS